MLSAFTGRQVQSTQLSAPNSEGFLASRLAGCRTPCSCCPSVLWRFGRLVGVGLLGEVDV
eukprot:8795902-Pyramimonas_sp.AAC.1